MPYKLNKLALPAQLSVGTLLVASLSQAQAAETCRAWQASDAQNKQLVVGDIKIEAGNIFDPTLPQENHWYHQTTNKLHIKTQDHVIAQCLLFKTGDRFHMALVAESERLLRARRHIKDASIEPEFVCGQQVQLRVSTTDNWTLAPALSFGRSGGNNSKSISIEEHNVLGLGKELSLAFKQDEQRNQTELTYNDPQVLGTRYHLSLGLQNNSDGQGRQLSLGLPFYKLASQQSAFGLETATLKQEVPHYVNGEVTYRTGVSTKNSGLFYGWSKERSPDFTERYRFGWQQEQRDYFATDSSNELGPTIDQSYPWFSYEVLEDKFTKRENFRTMGRVEDIALGHQFLIQAGLLHKELGSDADYLRLFSHYSKGYSPATNQLSLITADATTWLGKGQQRGLRANLKAEWNAYNSNDASWHLSAELHTADNLKPGEQLLLGGDNGLRGYPTGYRSGEHSALVSAERRYYFKQNPLSLARLGAAVFMDAGTTWGSKQAADWFGDAGFGLRIIPTRSSSGKIIHVDVAFPFAAKGKIDDYQILVGTGLEF
jgi:outer membrane protein assembly factor BamA